MTKKYLVSLTDAERETLFTLTKKGSLAARKLTLRTFCSRLMRV